MTHRRFAETLERATRATSRELNAMIREAIRCELDTRDASLKLLEIEADSKTIKGTRALTAILYLTAGNLCPWADSCRIACLLTAGRGDMESVKHGRARKTALWHRSPLLFWLLLERDLRKLERKAARVGGVIPAARLNGTSDIPWERFVPFMVLAAAHSAVQFYDYTKAPYEVRPDVALPNNYDLTASRGASWVRDHVAEMLNYGRRVAVVFDAEAYEHVIRRGRVYGFPVVDGDQHDERFMERPDVVVALKAKGKAKHDETGFVVRLEDLLYFASERN